MIMEVTKMTNLKCKLHNLGEKAHNILDKAEEVCEEYYWVILTGMVAITSLATMTIQLVANRKR